MVKSKLNKKGNKESKYDKYIVGKLGSNKKPNKDVSEYLDGPVKQQDEEKKTITSDLENVESPMYSSSPNEQYVPAENQLHVSNFGPLLETVKSCEQPVEPQNQQHDPMPVEIAVDKTTEIFGQTVEDSFKEDALPEVPNQSYEQSSFIEPRHETAKKVQEVNIDQKLEKVASKNELNVGLILEQLDHMKRSLVGPEEKE